MLTKFQSYALTTDQQQAILGGAMIGMMPLVHIARLQPAEPIMLPTPEPKPIVCGTPLPTAGPFPGIKSLPVIRPISSKGTSVW